MKDCGFPRCEKYQISILFILFFMKNSSSNKMVRLTGTCYRVFYLAHYFWLPNYISIYSNDNYIYKNTCLNFL